MNSQERLLNVQTTELVSDSVTIKTSINYTILEVI